MEIKNKLFKYPRNNFEVLWQVGGGRITGARGGGDWGGKLEGGNKGEVERVWEGKWEGERRKGMKKLKDQNVLAGKVDKC